MKVARLSRIKLDTSVSFCPSDFLLIPMVRNATSISGGNVIVTFKKPDRSPLGDLPLFHQLSFLEMA
jgi:hypothetical protein